MLTSKNLLIALMIACGLILLVTMTYIIPLFFLRVPETGSKVDSADSSGNKHPTETSDASPDDSASGPVIVIRPFQRLVTSEGKRELEIRASEATIDQAAREFLLTDIQEIEFFGENDETVKVSAGKGSWNQQTNTVSVSGDVRTVIESPRHEPITVTCQWIEYDNVQGTLTGGDDVIIRQKTYSARGNKLSIKPRINHLQLEDDVVAELKPEGFENRAASFFTDPLKIECGLMLFNGGANVMQFDRSPSVSSGRNRVTCGQISVFMGSENTRIVWKENCYFRVFLPKDKSGAPIEVRAEEVTMDRNAGIFSLQKSVSIQRDTALIRASDQIVMTIDPGSEEILGGIAQGTVEFEDTNIGGHAEAVSWDARSAIVILSGDAQLGNNRDTTINGNQIQLRVTDQYYTASKNVRIELAGGDSKPPAKSGQKGLFQGFTASRGSSSEPLVIWGDHLEIDEVIGRMSLDGDVRGVQGTSRFATNQLKVEFDSRTREIVELAADGNISLSDGDKMMTSGVLRYSAITGNLEIWENPVLWQNNSQIRADRFVYAENERVLRMTGNVEAVAILEPSEADGKEQKDSNRRELPSVGGFPSAGDDSLDDSYVHLSAGNGTYDESTGDLQFQNDVTMRKSLWNIQSESLQMQIDPASGRLLSANALGSVHVRHPLFDAKGHSLTYNPETSILVLRGTETQKCLVTQGERGSQGDEVRFFINENRFVIEKGISMIMPSEISGSLQ